MTDSPKAKSSALPGAGPAPQWGVQLWLVAGLSLGASAVYAVVRLADVLSRGPLSQAQAKLNTSQSPRPWFDLVYQLLDIGFALVPVALALWLMSRDRLYVLTGAASGIDDRPPCQRIGFDLRRLWRDVGFGALIFLVIGIGTLGVYAAGRALGVTAEVQPANLGSHWWTVPVLLLAAAKNGVLEEVLLLGFGVDRLQKLDVRPWLIVVGLALFRGSYHLYQGVGPFIGNVAMGLIFGWLYLRGVGQVRPACLARGGRDGSSVRSEGAERSDGVGKSDGAGQADASCRAEAAGRADASGWPEEVGASREAGRAREVVRPNEIGRPGEVGRKGPVQRQHRVMPFVIAHTLIDAVGFLAPGILALIDPLG